MITTHQMIIKSYLMIMNFEVFDKDYPIIKIIDENNFEEILKVSKDMRNNIRGQDIGGLG